MRPEQAVAERPQNPEVAVAPIARAGFLATLRAVAWSFFGVRARKGHETDAVSLNPIHVVIVGVLLAVLFVLTLLMVVRLVVA